MNFSIHSLAAAQDERSSRRLIAELQNALDRNYQTVRESARAHWETTQAGVVDPSDACVSVRITTGAAARHTAGAGILPTRKQTPSLANVWSLVLAS